MSHEDRTPGVSGETAGTPGASGETAGTPELRQRRTDESLRQRRTDGSLRRRRTDKESPRTETDQTNPLRPVLGLGALILLALLLSAGARSFRDLKSTTGYEQELLEKISETRERIRTLNSQIDSIRDDPIMLERLAREDLGMVLPGDVVIVLPEELPAVSEESSTPGRAGRSHTN